MIFKMPFIFIVITFNMKCGVHLIFSTFPQKPYLWVWVESHQICQIVIQITLQRVTLTLPHQKNELNTMSVNSYNPSQTNIYALSYRQLKKVNLEIIQFIFISTSGISNFNERQVYLLFVYIFVQTPKMQPKFVQKNKT